MPAFTVHTSDGKSASVDNATFPDAEAARQVAVQYMCEMMLDQKNLFSEGAQLAITVKDDTDTTRFSIFVSSQSAMTLFERGMRKASAL